MVASQVNLHLTLSGVVAQLAAYLPDCLHDAALFVILSSFRFSPSIAPAFPGVIAVAVYPEHSQTLLDGVSAIPRHPRDKPIHQLELIYVLDTALEAIRFTADHHRYVFQHFQQFLQIAEARRHGGVLFIDGHSGKLIPVQCFASVVLSGIDLKQGSGFCGCHCPLARTVRPADAKQLRVKAKGVVCFHIRHARIPDLLIHRSMKIIAVDDLFAFKPYEVLVIAENICQIHFHRIALLSLEIQDNHTYIRSKLHLFWLARLLLNLAVPPSYRSGTPAAFACIPHAHRADK